LHANGFGGIWTNNLDQLFAELWSALCIRHLR